MNNGSYICQRKYVVNMKGRPKNIRRISSVPTVSGFKAYGEDVKNDKKNAVFLFYEEYEAIRLNDYEKKTQCESAVVMGVSRPTFTRIYMSAREKIAKAFVEGCQIIIEGGKVRLDDDWRECQDCGAIFTIDDSDKIVCAICGSSNVDFCKLDNDSQIESNNMGCCCHRRGIRINKK